MSRAPRLGSPSARSSLAAARVFWFTLLNTGHTHAETHVPSCPCPSERGGGRWRGGGGGTKAERVLPGVHTCSPFEEGILNSGMGSVGCPAIELGLKKGFITGKMNCEWWTACKQEESHSLEERRIVYLGRDAVL